jgi:hypothetical protein
MMMHVANYELLRDDVLQKDDEFEYTFQSRAEHNATVDSVKKVNHRKKTKHHTKESQGEKPTLQKPIEDLVFEEDKYPSDHFALFDAILGMLSLVVLFILFW